MEHVARGQVGLPVGTNLPVAAEQITVAADDLSLYGVPDDELLVAVGTEVELVDVGALAGAAACGAEGEFALAADLAHHVGALVAVDNVDFVVAFVGHAHLALRRQFALEKLFVNGLDNFFFHCSQIVC